MESCYQFFREDFGSSSTVERLIRFFELLEARIVDGLNLNVVVKSESTRRMVGRGYDKNT